MRNTEADRKICLFIIFTAGASNGCHEPQLFKDVELAMFLVCGRFPLLKRLYAMNIVALG